MLSRVIYLRLAAALPLVVPLVAALPTGDARGVHFVTGLLVASLAVGGCPTFSWRPSRSFSSAAGPFGAGGHPEAMSRVERYWAQFLASLPQGRARRDRYVDAFFFGVDPQRAHEITALVLDGTKTATGALLWSLEAEGKPCPRPGDLSVVTDGSDDPRCIIRTEDVRILPFDEVGEEYARWGGEGDRSLRSWRTMYWDYIESECRRIGRTPHPKAPLVMERFRVVYSEPLADPWKDARRRTR